MFLIKIAKNYFPGIVLNVDDAFYFRYCTKNIGYDQWQQKKDA